MYHKDFDRSLHKQWDKEQEGDLPDSRLSGPRRRATKIMRGGMEYELCFCANCGKNGGAVTAEWSPHVFYLCDDCFLAGKGGPPGCVQADEELVRGCSNGGG